MCESVLKYIDDGIKVIAEDGVAELPDCTSIARSVAAPDRLAGSAISPIHLIIYGGGWKPPIKIN